MAVVQTLRKAIYIKSWMEHLPFVPWQSPGKLSCSQTCEWLSPKEQEREAGADNRTGRPPHSQLSVSPRGESGRGGRQTEKKHLSELVPHLTWLWTEVTQPWELLVKMLTCYLHTVLKTPAATSGNRIWVCVDRLWQEWVFSLGNDCRQLVLHHRQAGMT